MELNRKNILRILFIIFVSILFYLGLSHFSVVFKVLKRILSIITPFLFGIGFAFVLNLPLRFFETKIYPKLFPTEKKWAQKLKRPLALIFSFSFVAIIVVIAMLLIVPEIQATIISFIENLPKQIQQITDTINGLFERFDIPYKLFDNIDINWDLISKSLLDQFNTGGTVVIDTTLGLLAIVLGGIANFTIGIAFAIYILASKETLASQSRRLIIATTSEKIYFKIEHVLSLADDVFSKFVRGQATEAVILGVLTYIGMVILKLPYALMISSVVAVTALVPVVGALVGEAIGVLMILLSSPIQALWFLIFIMTLQQFENNVIYPKVVGTSVGLPGIWVLVAVVVGGSLFGVLGVLLSVPTTAVLYILVKDFVHQQLGEQES